MYDPNDVPDNISGARDDAPMEMKPLPANVPQRDSRAGMRHVDPATECANWV